MMTRCECWELSFVALLSYARRHGITRLEDLMQATGCGTRCGTCRPYLEELLRSGKLRVGDQLIELPGLALGDDSSAETSAASAKPPM